MTHLRLHNSKLKCSFTLLSILVLLGVSLIAFVANAQEPEIEPYEVDIQPSSTTGELRSEEQQELREERQEEKREVRTAALSERTQARVENLAANMSNKMDAAVFRLEQISGRLRSRIAKLEATGVNVSASRANLEDAERSLEDAAGFLGNIDTAVLEAVQSETPNDAWQQVKFQYQQTDTALRSAHQSLRATVATLKTAVRDAQFGNGVSSAVQNDASVSTTTDEAAE